MQRRMARRARVELPASDAPNVIGAGLSIVCGLAIGVGAVAWMQAANERGREDLSRAAPPPPTTAKVAAKPPAPTAERDAAVSVAPAIEVPPGALLAPSTGSVMDAGPSRAAPVLGAGGRPPSEASSEGTVHGAAPEVAPRPARALTFVPGRVAYVRCDGVAKHEGRFPCPRDRALERGAWEALRSLEHCPRLGPGGADVRLEFGPQGPPAVHVLSPRTGNSLDRDLVAKCVGMALGQTRTALRADRMLVAFEVTLRAPMTAP
jgi:hypothetical protein